MPERVYFQVLFHVVDCKVLNCKIKTGCLTWAEIALSYLFRNLLTSEMTIVAFQKRNLGGDELLSWSSGSNQPRKKSGFAHTNSPDKGVAHRSFKTVDSFSHWTIDDSLGNPSEAGQPQQNYENHKGRSLNLRRRPRNSQGRELKITNSGRDRILKKDELRSQTEE